MSGHFLDRRASSAAIVAALVVIIGVQLGAGLSSAAAPDRRQLCEWTRVDTPAIWFDALRAVHAFTPTDAWAVGHYAGPGPDTLALHWDGKAWTHVPTPSHGNADSFAAVSATSPRDVWAVGTWDGFTRTKTLIEHLNGQRWEVIASPNPGPQNNFLHDVVAISPNDVWAVGASADQSGGGRTLIEHWDGDIWHAVPDPNVDLYSSLESIDAASPSDIWAVGASGSGGLDLRPLIQRWDGSSWSVVPSPDWGTVRAGLAAVAVVARDNVWAVGTLSQGVGSAETLIEHWDGKEWGVVPSPNNSTGVSPSVDILIGVAAAGPRDVWAVGATGSYPNQQPLVLHWDGYQWSVGGAERVGTNAYFNGVSALRSGRISRSRSH